MANKNIRHVIIRSAPRGSKRGWRAVTGELRPEEFEQLEQLVLLTGRRRTDLVAEAVRAFLDTNKAA